MNSLLASSSQDVYSHPNISQHDGKCVGREFRTKHQLQCEYMTMLVSSTLLKAIEGCDVTEGLEA